MSGNRDAHKALLEGRRKLEIATNGVNQLVRQVNSGAMLCRPAAEDALKRRRDLIVEYTKLTRALKAAAASLAAARTALDHLDTKLMASKP